MRSITSDANASFRQWLRLATQPRAVRDARRTLAEGIHLAEMALATGHPIEAALLRRGTNDAEIQALLARLADAGIRHYELAPGLFDRLSPVEHGVGLILELHVTAPPLPAALERDALYLDGIQEPGNAGALLRVAAAAGVEHVFAATGTTALWAPKSLRAGQGAHFRLKLFEGVTADAAAASFRGAWIAAAAHDAEPLWDARLPAGPVGWVLGAEGQGVSSAMLKLCGSRIRIPLAAGVESLNVAAAAAVCLFERRRRLDRM
jgi:TrmH family RNA methyltransferase